MTVEEGIDLAKNFVGIATSLVALADTKFSLLPINPGIRDQLIWLSVVLALLAGFGGHQYAKRSGKIWFGWMAFGLAVASAFVILAGGQGSLDWLSPQSVSLTSRIAYVGFFASLGGAFGGFLR